MPSAFINYRREETSGYAGRLYGDLKETLGADTVFMDLNIEPGEDFTEVINDRVASCDVQLVIIGKQWARLKDDSEQLRIDNPDDFVRLEIGAALRRQIRVIPILVQGATLPKRDQLPDDLKGLVSRQAFEISDSRWDHDVAQLSDVVKKIFGAQAARSAASAARADPSPATPRPAVDVRPAAADPKPTRHEMPSSPPPPAPAPAPRPLVTEPATTFTAPSEAGPVAISPVRMYVTAALATLVVFVFAPYADRSSWAPWDTTAMTVLIVLAAAVLLCAQFLGGRLRLESRVAIAALWGASTLAAAHLLPNVYIYWGYGPLETLFAGVLSYAVFLVAAHLLVVKRQPD